jgi:hypothetical protein
MFKLNKNYYERFQKATEDLCHPDRHQLTGADSGFGYAISGLYPPLNHGSDITGYNYSRSWFSPPE